MTLSLQTQAEMERAAVDLISRPDVRSAVAAEARRWRAGTPGFLPETYAQLGTSIDEVAVFVALQVVNGDSRRPRVVEISAGPHTWGGLDVPGGRWGINNPDTLYFSAPVESGSRYVLRGRRRGAEPTDLNVSVQVADVFTTLDSIGREELRFDDDGGFALTVGGRPGEEANHLPIRDGGTVLFVRQTLADWTDEVPYELSVERTDGADAEQQPAPDQLARQLIDRLGVVITHSLMTLQLPVFGLPVNTIPQPGPAGARPGYLVAQRNTLGHFRLDDHEALLLELSPGRAVYASVVAPTIWGVTTDSTRHQNSLNTAQVDLDAEGRLTAVVANRDPGVVNWIDPGGLREGILMLRWQLLSDDPTDQPGVTVRRVRADDLPKGLRRMSPAGRRRQLAGRAAAYARRFDLR